MHRRRALALAAALAPMSTSISLATLNDSWINTAGGTWTVATNWGLGAAPVSTTYNAIIAITPTNPFTVNIASTFSVNSITVSSSNATILHTTGNVTTPTINLSAGTYTLGNPGGIGTITSATVNLNGGTMNLANAALTSVTFSGADIAVPASSALYVQGGLANPGRNLNVGVNSVVYFDGDQTENNISINSNGSSNTVIRLGSPFSTNTASTLTLGTSASLTGPFEIFNYVNSGGYTLINNGTINSNSSGNATYVESTNCTNNGLAEATNGGTLEIDSTNFTNNGTLSVGATCKLTVFSDNLVQNGTVTCAAGSQVSIKSGTTTFLAGTVQNGGTLLVSGSSTVKQSGSNVTNGAPVIVAPINTDQAAYVMNSGSLVCQQGAQIGPAGTGTFTQTSGSTSFTGALSAGNTGVLTAGSGAGTINVSGGTMYADTVLLGSTAGGSGAMTVSGTASVTIGGGAHLNDLTVNGGTVTVLNATPPVGEDPELNRALVGGYLSNGALNINGGVVTSPYAKFGITSGKTGTYSQTAGSASVSILSGGCDNSITAGSGTGVINISGGSLYADTVLLGSTLGGAGAMTISGTGSVTIGGGAHLNDITINAGSLTVLNTTPPVGEDPELNRALVGGYLTNGALNINGGTVISPYAKFGITSGKTGTYTQTAGSASVSILSGGCDNSITAGSGTGVINISGGSLYADTVLLGSTAGGAGAMTISGTGTVTIGGGAHLNDITVNAGSLTVLNATPPAGEDPELNRALVGGYLTNGALLVNGGVVNSPYLKFGITAGKTGSFVQTAGNVSVSTLCLGADAVGLTAAGIGSATISGGTLSIGTLILGSTAGGVGSLTISSSAHVGASVVNSSGTIAQSSGVSSLGTVSGSGTITVNGGSLTATSIRQRTLNIGSSSLAVVAFDSQAHTHGTPLGTSCVTTLSVNSNGTLDLTNNGIVILDTTALGAVRSLITSAADVTAGMAHWDHAGITSSTAFADPAVHAVGYAQASALGSTSFNGITFSDAVLARYTLLGDASLKGTVDLSDYTKVVLNLGKSNASWSDGNFDYSGNVNLGDYTKVVVNMGRTDGQSTVFDGTGPTAQQVKFSALTLKSTPALAQTTTATDVTLLVNPSNGRVTLVNVLQTGQAVITAYTINSPSQSLLPFSADGGGKYLANALENNPSVFYKASNGLTYNLWTGIKNVSTFIGEGFSNHYNANVDSTWTNYTLATSGYALGTLFKRLSSGGTRDLVFQWEDANLNTYTSVVSYVNVPEPTGISLLAAGAIAVLGRRRRRHRHAVG